MAVRVVEWKKPYTWGKAIEVTDEKVINLRLREENNLIIYDEWDDEIYVDLQLRDWIRPLDAFPVGVTTGRVLIADDWDKTGTIICAKTTSGDNIKILYADDWTLWIDNWTWLFKQIYFRADVDLIAQRLQAQIDVLYSLWKFLSLWDSANGEPMSFPLTIPYEYSTWDWYMIGNVSSAEPAVNYRPVGDERDDTPSTTQETESIDIGDVYIYDWTTWLLQHNKLPVGSGNVIGPDSATDGHLAVFDWATGKIIKDWWPIPEWDTIEYVTQTEYNNLPASKTSDDKHYFIYSFPTIPVTWVILNESSISLTTVGDTYQLTATVSPNDATDKSVTWSSSDQSVATVSSTWLVTCVTPWTATITVTTTDWWFTATCDVDGWWWQPWANTVCYFPLDTDFEDTVTWTALTWYNSATIWTLWTVSCLDLTSSNSYLDWTISTLPQWGQARTNMFWVYYPSYWNYPAYWYWSWVNTQGDWVFKMDQSEWPVWSQYWKALICWAGTVSTWQWYHIAITVNGSTEQKMYINWVYKVSTAWSVNTNWTTLYLGKAPWGNNYLNWYLSKFIIEDKVRTAQEISDYFDLTKWDYWIS